MSDELRAKIADRVWTTPGLHEKEAMCLVTDILALITPPATAKLPEGVEVVRDMIDTFTERWYVKSGLYRLDQDDGLVWSKAAYNMFRTYDDALTAALSAPPVPGKSGNQDVAHFYGLDKREPTESELKACIAELEAEVANTRGVVRVATKLRDEGGKNLGTVDELHYALASLGLHTPAEKPDARKVAPNGRAMARYELCGPNRESNMHGIDDEGHDWAWLHDPGEWIEPFPACMDSRRTLCTFDGTPITEPKPDPLSRAVTVGEMLRLAEHYDKRLSSLSTAMSASIRFIFAPQGAEHVE